MERRQVEMTIYRNGSYSIVPLLVGLVVKGKDGKVLGKYPVERIEDAVGDVDHMAQLDGYFEAVSM